LIASTTAIWSSAPKRPVFVYADTTGEGPADLMEFLSATFRLPDDAQHHSSQSANTPSCRAGTHASSPIASALERHPTGSVLLFCALALGTDLLAFGIGVLVYTVIAPVPARPARRVL
jgi:hypothetical protein